MGTTFSLAATRAALVPRHGGQIVEELVTMPSANEFQEVYRWADGDVIEWCDHGAYVSRIGDPTSMLIDLEYIARVGEQWPDAYALETQTSADLRSRNGTSDRTETVLMSADDVEEAFFFAETLGRLFPSKPVARVRLVQRHAVDREFDEQFGVSP
jgi:hypothetical protein